MVTVVLTPEAVRDIYALPSPLVARMDKLIARLRQGPIVGDAKSLKGDLPGHYRLRLGDYGLQFRVERARKVFKVKRVVKGDPVVEEKEIVEIRMIV